jgi:hypothetical protein
LLSGSTVRSGQCPHAALVHSRRGPSEAILRVEPSRRSLVNLTPSGRAGFRRLWHGLRQEIVATVSIVRQTSILFWVWCLAMFVPLSLVGLLPLGRLSLVLQAIGLGLFGLVMLFPSVLARVARSDDELGLRDREGAALVAYLPALIELAALPFFVAGQTILFRLVMQQVPGALPGNGWTDAWMVSLNNLLFSEIFFDVIDVFRLGLAPDPVHRLGQVLIFLTRLILSVAFIRVIVQLFRAAYFQAHGLGRGVDLVAALRTAADERDLGELGHVGDALSTGLDETIETLAARVRAAPTAEAWRGLLALREWAIPFLERRMANRPADAHDVAPLLERLRRGDPPSEPVSDPFRRTMAVTALVALVGGVLAAALVPGWIGLSVGIVVMALLGLLLVAPRTSLERCMNAGILPACPASRLSAATLLWSAGLAVTLVLVAFFAFDTAAHVATGVFQSAGAAPDRADIAGFVLANLLRLQLFLSAPDIFAMALPPIEHQPLLGSALTLLFRTALNLGLVSVFLTALSVSYTRAVTGSRLVANAELTLRIEALRGGRFGPALARHHAELVQEELWNLLIETDDPEVRRALAALRVYEWRTASSPPLALGERLAAASLALGLADRGSTEPALRMLAGVGADGRLEHLFPAVRVAVEVERGLVLQRAGMPEEAAEALRDAETRLARDAAGMTSEERERSRTELERAMAAQRAD